MLEDRIHLLVDKCSMVQKRETAHEKMDNKILRNAVCSDSWPAPLSRLWAAKCFRYVEYVMDWIHTSVRTDTKTEEQSYLLERGLWGKDVSKNKLMI